MIHQSKQPGEFSNMTRSKQRAVIIRRHVQRDPVSPSSVLRRVVWCDVVKKKLARKKKPRKNRRPPSAATTVDPTRLSRDTRPIGLAPAQPPTNAEERRTASGRERSLFSSPSRFSFFLLLVMDRCVVVSWS